MLTCKICGSNCDAADLVNGICDDCRELRERRDEIKERHKLAEMTPPFGLLKKERLDRGKKWTA